METEKKNILDLNQSENCFIRNHESNRFAPFVFAGDP